ncbi:hypothetical protein CEXT_518961 [Caerostris extrusa]|uniref:Uncharacterized protein n=1 Tax=Caerostris extrusa TaxID=172846 RepID=A0AAV4R000_CAEEX|nr:hypothetical protein CEXT_518961 [Caerostris extrusa]
MRLYCQLADVFTPVIGTTLPIWLSVSRMHEFSFMFVHALASNARWWPAITATYGMTWTNHKIGWISNRSRGVETFSHPIDAASILGHVM